MGDIFKDSFLDGFSAADLTIRGLLIMLGVAAILGIYIFYIYRVVCRRAFYSKSFAIALVVITMITTTIILAVQSSIVISLGMVGALSIVRFRTAIKDPMDLAFLFWSISVGIICGAGLYKMAVVSTLVITIVMLFLHFIPNMKPIKLMIINCTEKNASDTIIEIVKEKSKHFSVKSKNITASGLDMIIDVKAGDYDELVNAVAEIETVKSVTLMSHEGEVTY